MFLRQEKKQILCAKSASGLERDHLQIFEHEAHHHHVVPKRARSIRNFNFYRCRSSAMSSAMDRALALKANLEERKPYVIKPMDVSNGYCLGLVAGDTTSSIYVGNVDYSCKAEDVVRQHFEDCGTVNWVTILTDMYYCQPRGCAFVEFVEAEGVQNALLLNESELRGRRLKVAPKRRTNIPRKEC